MPERIAEFFNSRAVDVLVKMAVPALLGVSGYFFSFILDTSARIVAIENSRFTADDGRRMGETVAHHSAQIMVLDSNQKRVMTSIDKMVENQMTMMQTQARIEANIMDLQR
jgi:hypothetical protein